MFKLVNEQVGIGGGHTGAMAVPLTWRKCWELKEKLLWVRINCVSLEEEMSGWLGVGRALIQEIFLGREAMGMGDVVCGMMMKGREKVKPSAST